MKAFSLGIEDFLHEAGVESIATADRVGDFRMALEVNRRREDGRAAE